MQISRFRLPAIPTFCILSLSHHLLQSSLATLATLLTYGAEQHIETIPRCITALEVFSRKPLVQMMVVKTLARL
jgi:hypothetical protein